jgi:hypothetical protein
MKGLFLHKNSSLITELDHKGFCTFPLLNAQDLIELKAIYSRYTNNKFSGFHPTMFHKDPIYREKMNEAIINRLKPHFENILSDTHEILYGNFMVKEQNSASAMKIHQDWTYVDETKFKSYAFWIPLCDLTEENGALWVVPFSHRANNLERGPGTFCPFYEHFEYIKDNLSKPLYLKAGEAVCWDHRLAHFSPENKSNEARLAITVIVVPKEADIYHYFKPQTEDIIKKYNINSSFFFNYSIGTIPQLTSVESKAYTPKHLSEEELLALTLNTINEKNDI